MKNNNKEVWIGHNDLNSPELQEMAKQEFANNIPVVDTMADEQVMESSTNRRDFLKYLGFGLGAATVAASCEIPVKRAIPYVVKPDEIVPGVATYYASSFVKGGDYTSILVKTREGRPIKIEGNSLSPVTHGGTTARAQAAVLDLYNVNRLQNPTKDWAEMDAEIKGALASANNIRIITNTNMSPTAQKAMGEFLAAYPNAQVVTYDAVSASGMLEANEASFGVATIPNYHFDKADNIISFGADFLGTWISAGEYAYGYAKNRKVDPKAENPTMSHHTQVESYMSLTGSNADNRIMVRPSEQGAAIKAFYNALVGNSMGSELNEKASNALKALANKVKGANGKTLVVSGSNNVAEQVVVNAINEYLGSYGSTITFDRTSNQRQGLDKPMGQLVSDLKGGKVDALIVMDANPAYDLPEAADFAEAMAKVKTSVFISTVPNETGALCKYVAPAPHFLEAWGDVEPKAGMYSIIQPTIAPLFNTRQAEESLLVWADSSNLNAEADQPYYEYLKANWEANMFPKQNNFLSFQTFWDKTLHDGVFTAPVATSNVRNAADVNTYLAQIAKPGQGEEIVLFETVAMGAGQYAENPWLQELPDPVTRTTWGNYFGIPITWEGGNSMVTYQNLNQEEYKGKADVVEVSVNGKAQDITCIASFGLAANTFSAALGFGRTEVGFAGKGVGTNSMAWLSRDKDGNVQYFNTLDAEPKPTGEIDYEFPCVQYHHTFGITGQEDGKEINVDEKTLMAIGEGFQGGLTDRSIIYQANLSEVNDLKAKIAEKRDFAKHLNEATLYPYEEYQEKFYSQGHHWGMAIDLNACMGCGACQVACVAENNVPVVGKTEVSRHHEMTWLRIDRYFFGDHENPNTVYQPMMCQHCDNAPCENVCPVGATNHSSEGLNQMTYNRCIGTRYCANNCPFKVRRLNWYDYTTADLFGGNEVSVNGEEIPFGADNLTRMVLNPDVTVRSRGVIEKCSFCVQRIQEGKLTAKKEGRSLREGDIKPACQTACVTGAITFGDFNNENGALAKALDSELNYLVLEETNVQSSVHYSAKIINRDEAIS